MTTESSVQLPPDSTGKLVDTFTSGSGGAHRQAMVTGAASGGQTAQVQPQGALRIVQDGVSLFSDYFATGAQGNVTQPVAPSSSLWTCFAGAGEVAAINGNNFQFSSACAAAGSILTSTQGFVPSATGTFRATMVATPSATATAIAAGVTIDGFFGLTASAGFVAWDPATESAAPVATAASATVYSGIGFKQHNGYLYPVVSVAGVYTYVGTAIAVDGASHVYEIRIVGGVIYWFIDNMEAPVTGGVLAVGTGVEMWFNIGAALVTSTTGTSPAYLWTFAAFGVSDTSPVAPTISIADPNTPSQKLAIDSSGRATVNVNDPTNTIILNGTYSNSNPVGTPTLIGAALPAGTQSLSIAVKGWVGGSYQIFQLIDVSSTWVPVGCYGQNSGYSPLGVFTQNDIIAVPYHGLGFKIVRSPVGTGSAAIIVSARSAPFVEAALGMASLAGRNGQPTDLLQMMGGFDGVKVTRLATDQTGDLRIHPTEGSTTDDGLQDTQTLILMELRKISFLLSRIPEYNNSGKNFIDDDTLFRDDLTNHEV